MPTMHSLLTSTNYSPTLFRAGASLAAFAVFGASLYATPVSGTLNLNPTTLFGVNLTTTDFNYAGGTPSSATFGSFLVGPGSTDSFAPYIGDAGLVRSFDRADVPLGTPTALANFIQLPTPTPTIEFVLTELVPGSEGSADCGAAPAAGQACTPPIPGGSPFNLANVANGSGGLNATASLSFNVEAFNLITGETSNGQGVFDATFVDANYQELLATIEAGGVITGPYTGNFKITFASTPEPSSIAFVGGGLLLLLAGLMRRVARRQHS